MLVNVKSKKILYEEGNSKIEENHRPVVGVACSHEHSCIFGVIRLEGTSQ